MSQIARRAGYPGPAQVPVPAPGHPDTRSTATVSPRTDMMGKMNNIADFVLGSNSVSPKQLSSLENGMGRMNIGHMMEDVNKNKTDKNGSYNDNVNVEENGNSSPNGVDNESNIRTNGSRQASPSSQDEQNGNVPDDNGKS